MTSPPPDPPTPPIPNPTLHGEHRDLLSAVTELAAPVLAEADAGRWPRPDLHALLDYLHLEVLSQINDEEWLLFRASAQDPDTLTRLRQDHLDLRDTVHELTGYAASPEQCSTQQLAALTRGLLTALQAHLTVEEHTLSAAGVLPSMSSLGQTPHSWYPHTTGLLIDLDALPGPRGVDAVLARMLRMPVDEEIELRASVDPGPLWRRLAMADPGGYGFNYLEQGPPTWRVQITRRTQP